MLCTGRPGQRPVTHVRLRSAAMCFTPRYSQCCCRNDYPIPGRGQRRLIRPIAELACRGHFRFGFSAGVYNLLLGVEPTNSTTGSRVARGVARRDRPNVHDVRTGPSRSGNHNLWRPAVPPYNGGSTARGDRSPRPWPRRPALHCTARTRVSGAARRPRSSRRHSSRVCTSVLSECTKRPCVTTRRFNRARSRVSKIRCCSRLISTSRWSSASLDHHTSKPSMQQPAQADRG